MRDSYLQNINTNLSNPDVCKPREPIFKIGDSIKSLKVTSVLKKNKNDFFILEDTSAKKMYHVLEVIPQFEIGENVYFIEDSIELSGEIKSCRSDISGEFKYSVSGARKELSESELYRTSFKEIERKILDARRVPETSKDLTKQTVENKHLINDVCRAAAIASQYDYFNSLYRGKQKFEVVEGTVFKYDPKRQVGYFKPSSYFAKLLSSVNEKQTPNFLSRKASRFAITLQEAYRDLNEPLYEDAYAIWQKKFKGSQKDFTKWVIQKIGG